MHKLPPLTLSASQWLGPKNSSSVHPERVLLVGFATMCQFPLLTVVRPCPMRKRLPSPHLCCLSGAINQCFWLSSVHATQIRPKVYSLWYAKSKGRTLQDHTSSSASGKRTTVPSPQPTRVVLFPCWEWFFDFPLTPEYLPPWFVFCCFTTRETTIHNPLQFKHWAIANIHSILFSL